VTKPNVFGTYYQLTKPGIVYGNVLTALGGFLLASKGHINGWLLLATLAGIALVIGSACVLNNCLDRNIDQKMARTKKRAVANGTVPVRKAVAYSILLGMLGFVVLGLWTNWLTVLLGAIAIIDYVVVYGISKRRSAYGTIVGSVAGALPIAGGYTAVAGRFDLGALLLFLILVCWQMPHFYAIAIRRQHDYAAAGIPVWPIRKGVPATKYNIIAYVAAFVLAAVALAVFGYAGYVYLAVMGVVGVMWLWKGVKGFHAMDDIAWARSMFLFSLVVILALSASLSIDAWMP